MPIDLRTTPRFYADTGWQTVTMWLEDDGSYRLTWLRADGGLREERCYVTEEEAMSAFELAPTTVRNGPWP